MYCTVNDNTQHIKATAEGRVYLMTLEETERIGTIGLWVDLGFCVCCDTCNTNTNQVIHLNPGRSCCFVQ